MEQTTELKPAEAGNKLKYKMEHDRANCISCGACAAVTPQFWTMSEKDGKSDIVGSVMRPDGWEELEIEEKDFACNKEAADSCPVNVIHITKKDTNEKII